MTVNVINNSSYYYYYIWNPFICNHIQRL